MEKISVQVRGEVQGVGYRYSTVNTARALGLLGWVRNLADGSVEIEAVGEAAALEKLLIWCQSGPPRARVTHVDVRSRGPVSGPDYSDFTVR